MLSKIFDRRKSFLEMLIMCLVTIMISCVALYTSNDAHAANVPLQTTGFSQTQIKNLEGQSTNLYEQLHHLKRSQAEIDAALLHQFGLQRINANKATNNFVTPFSSTNSAISLPTTNIYQSRGTTFLYSYFNWNTNFGASYYGEPQDYNDVFGTWFSRNVVTSSTYLSVTDIGGGQTNYQNPTNFGQAGADYSQNANYWQSGVLSISLKGSFPSGCTQIFTKYTHGWSTSEITSLQLSAGLPAAFGVSVTYSNVGHSWQATGPTPARYGC